MDFSEMGSIKTAFDFWHLLLLYGGEQEKFGTSGQHWLADSRFVLVIFTNLSAT